MDNVDAIEVHAHRGECIILTNMLSIWSGALHSSCNELIFIPSGLWCVWNWSTQKLIIHRGYQEHDRMWSMSSWISHLTSNTLALEI